MFEAFRWYIVLQLFGLAALPIALHFFRFLPDRGYAFARPLGLLLVGYFLWAGAVFGLLENRPATVLVVLLIVAGVSWTLLRSQIAVLREMWRSNRSHILAVEGIFLAFFVIWTLVRAYNPEIQATEKPMEFAFLNATLRSSNLPPTDPWLSGFSISYYYFGYLIVAMVTMLSMVPSTYAFNLAIAMLFALTATGAYSVGYNLAEGVIRGPGEGDGASRPKRLIGPWVAGAGAVFALLIMSNWEMIFELLHSHGIGAPAFWNLIGIKDLSRPYYSPQLFPLDAQDNWWWFRASRVIGDYTSPDGKALDYTINEFPFFSFILGDMHPHVLALPFVLMAIGYSLNLLRSNVSLTARYLVRRPIELAFLSVLFGGLWFLNAWDMLTYLFVLALTFTVRHSLEQPGTSAKWIYEVLAIFLFPLAAVAWAALLALALVRKVFGLPPKAWPGLWDWLERRVSTMFLIVLIGSVLAYLPFYVTFRTQASIIPGAVLVGTQWHHFLIFWGPLLFICGSLLVAQMATGLRGVPMLSKRASKVIRGIPASDWTRQWWVWPAVIAFTLALFALRELAVSLAISIAPALRPQLPGDPFIRLATRGPVMALVVFIVVAAIARVWRLMIAEVEPATAESLEAAQRRTGSHPTRRRPTALEAGRPVEIAGGAAVASLAREHIFALLLLLTGFLLIFGTEVVFIRDFFGNRMNTVFKLYYQAWTLLAIVAGYTIYYFAGFARAGLVGLKPYVTRIWLAIALIVVVIGLIYPVGATLSKTGYFNRQPTLDGFAWYERIRADDYRAIKWLRENVQGNPVILEATGGSYSAFGRVSANTGLPTLLGWDFHQQQWRGSFDEQGKRKGDIDILFRSTNMRQVTDLMNKYKIKYVYVGPLERDTYSRDSSAGLQKFATFMDVVYNQDGVTIYRSRGSAS